MSRPLPGAHTTETWGPRCSPLAGRALMGVNYNTSTECSTSRPDAIVEDGPDSFTIVIPPTEDRNSPDLARSSFVIEDVEGSSPQTTNSSQFPASSTRSPANPTTSLFTPSTSLSKSSASSSVASLTPTSTLSSCNSTSSVPSTSISSAVARPPQQDDPGNPPKDPPPTEFQPGTGNSPPDNPPLSEATSPSSTTPSSTSPSSTSPSNAPPRNDNPPNNPPPGNTTPPSNTPPSNNPSSNNPPSNTPSSNTPPSSTPPSNTPPSNPPPGDTPSPSGTSPGNTSPSNTFPNNTPPNNPSPASKPTDRNTPQDSSSQMQKSTNDSTQAPKASTPEPQVEAKPTSVETSSTENRQSSSNGVSNTPVASVAPPSSSNVNSPTSQTANPATSGKGKPENSGSVNNPGAKPSDPGVVAPAIPIPTTLETTANTLSPTAEKEAQDTFATSASPIATKSFPGNLPDTTSTSRPQGGKGPVDPGVSPASSSHGKIQMSTGAIVGISVGSIAFIALIALSIWLCRRRSKKQRVESMLNPPLTRSDRGPKTREMAALGATKSCLFQWLPGTGKDLTGDNNSESSTIARAIPNMSERTAMPGLLGGDAISNYPPAQPGYNGHFRGKYSINGANWPELGANQGQVDPLNPFSDRNAVELSGQPPSLPPLALFFDMPGEYQSRPMPSTGPAKSRQSRGRSLSLSVRASQYPAAQPLESRPHSVHRESVQSIDSFTTRRNKFRSDPFDLEEIESRLLSGQSQVPEMPRRTVTSSKYSSGAGSASSSRYTSGISVSDWSLMNATRTTGPSAPAPANKLVSWDNLSSVDDFRPGNRRQPSKDKKNPGVVFGQAL
ncbi:hypothetical protein H633G_03167 [Metarhizium anisopliae BRIP 53284]|nr:hypothetical protein H633G_03167 [Metarhizium anisopliae BRIP 53284]